MQEFGTKQGDVAWYARVHDPRCHMPASSWEITSFLQNLKLLGNHSKYVGNKQPRTRHVGKTKEAPHGQAAKAGA